MTSMAQSNSFDVVIVQTRVCSALLRRWKRSGITRLQCANLCRRPVSVC